MRGRGAELMKQIASVRCLREGSLLWLKTELLGSLVLQMGLKEASLQLLKLQPLTFYGGEELATGFWSEGSCVVSLS